MKNKPVAILLSSLLMIFFASWSSAAEAATALIYRGAGANASDVTSIGRILTSHGVSYSTADHTRFNSMTVADFAMYKVIIFPGGDSNPMNDNLTGRTRLRVKQAIVQYGVGYTGFCAGAWMAVGPYQSISSIPYWGFGFVTGAYLKLYHPNGLTPMATMVPTKFASGDVRQLVWWGGPALPEIANSVVARYADGVPAIVAKWAGKGFVTITGPHPEAPQSWRDGLLNDTDGLDYDVAWRLIKAAIYKSPLETY